MLRTPQVNELTAAVQALREWQHDDAPMQLHPGDIGWAWRLGAEATAAAVRTWSRDGRILAVGFLDQPDLLRFTMAPDAHHDEDLAQQLAEDVKDPSRGVLPAGKVYIESPKHTRFQEQMFSDGWQSDEPWTPLRRDLSQPVEDPEAEVEVIGPGQAHEYAEVIRASFDRSTFTEERWHNMASGPYEDARSLVAYAESQPVAAVTVWSAGPGKPGLLEPMGVHRDHRGRGFGKAITIAAAKTLQQLGSSTALVCTPSSNEGAVATYKAAGFQPMPEVFDQRRD
ncbi:GNAT family N-acetyltransferase [Lentzea alba]|uniref:GNAT family N-acetyltransferase n=1 Tax=Lentzea alba TaxID=2714351 RepID=UPI0039BF827A